MTVRNLITESHLGVIINKFSVKKGREENKSVNADVISP